MIPGQGEDWNSSRTQRGRPDVGEDPNWGNRRGNHGCALMNAASLS